VRLTFWVCALPLVSSCVIAQESGLDLSFGGSPYGGAVNIPFDNPASTLRDEGSDIVALPSGGYLIAGTVHTAGGGFDIGVTRVTAQGTLDATFGDQGHKVIPVDVIQAGADRATSLAIDSQGRIVIGGIAQGTTKPQGVVIRLTAQGQPDASFGPGGVHAIAEGGGLDYTGTDTEVAVGAMDSIYFGMVVRPQNGATGVYYFGRIASNGQRDASFGTSGNYVVPIPGGSAVSMRDIEIQGQSLMACGGATVGSNVRWVFALAPVDNGPTPFTAMPVTGEATVDAGRDVCFDIEPSRFQASRFYLAGNAKVAGVRNAVVAAVNFSGALDPSWSGDGLARFVFAGQQDVRVDAIVERGNGTVLFGGSIERAGTGWDAFAAQLLPQGALDGAFAPTGVSVYPGVLQDAREEHFADVVEQAGRPVFAGSMQFGAVNSTDLDFLATALVRETTVFFDGFE
jgi:uncharacterized delta-60 repeat protein